MAAVLPTKAVLPTNTRALSAADLSAVPSRRKITNAVMSALLALSLLVVLVPLVLILLTVVTHGVKVMGTKFLTGDLAASERRATGGIGPAIVGTLLSTGLATLIAVPLGVLGAIYLAEYDPRGLLGRVVRFMASVMTGVPSIVMGLFVYVLYTLHFKQNAFGAALALACLMLPIVIRSTEEVLRLVPNQLREASFGLGAGKARTIRSVVLPAALPGVLSGSLLAVARASGETAPLLFTIGASKALNLNPFGGANNAIPLQIYANANSNVPAAQNRGWGAALTLVALAFGFTLIARLIAGRRDRKR
jgi:phosphate transport system permease protein